VGGLSVETIKTIKTARIIGLLQSRGFTKRLINMPPATPIHDDKTGRYNVLSLDGFLINPATRFDDLKLTEAIAQTRVQMEGIVGETRSLIVRIN